MSDNTTTEGTATADTAAETLPDTAEPLTQADVDRIVKDRLARERAKFSDYEELKAAAGRLAVIEDAQKTESDRLAERVTAAEAQVTRANEMLMRAAIATAAARAGAVDLDAVASLLDRGGITMDEDGTVTGADEAIEALLAAKPYLRAGTTAPALPTAPGTATTSGTPAPMTPQEVSALDPKALAADPELFARVLEARSSWK
jgi:hypothetical protein